MKASQEIAALRAELAELREWRADVEQVLGPKLGYLRAERHRLAKARRERDLRVELLALAPRARNTRIAKLEAAEHAALAVTDPAEIVTLVEGLAPVAVAIVRGVSPSPHARAWIDAVANGVPERVVLRLKDPGNARNHTREIEIHGRTLTPDEVAILRPHGEVADYAHSKLRGFRLVGPGTREMSRDALDARLAVDEELRAHVNAGDIVVDAVPLADARKRWVEAVVFGSGDAGVERWASGNVSTREVLHASEPGDIRASTGT